MENRRRILGKKEFENQFGEITTSTLAISLFGEGTAYLHRARCRRKQVRAGCGGLCRRRQTQRRFRQRTLQHADGIEFVQAARYGKLGHQHMPGALQHFFLAER